MNKKSYDWFFWGPMLSIVVLALILFSTSATKLPNGNYIFDQSIFSYFIVGLMFLCAALLIFGKVRESMGGKINGRTIVYTAIAVPVVFVLVYFINN
jgi:hypothetical protein